MSVIERLEEKIAMTKAMLAIGAYGYTFEELDLKLNKLQKLKRRIERRNNTARKI